MMTELGTQLKQAEQTQLPLKRKKRDAKKSEEEVERGGGGPRLGENPMAKYSLEDFVGVLKSMRSLRVAFDDLMESYRVYKNNQEADKVEADIGDDDDKEDDNDKDDDGGDEPQADEKSEEDDESKEDDEDEVDKEGGDDGKDDESKEDDEDEVDKEGGD